MKLSYKIALMMVVSATSITITPSSFNEPYGPGWQGHISSGAVNKIDRGPASMPAPEPAPEPNSGPVYKSTPDKYHYLADEYGKTQEQLQMVNQQVKEEPSPRLKKSPLKKHLTLKKNLIQKHLDDLNRGARTYRHKHEKYLSQLHDLDDQIMEDINPEYEKPAKRLSRRESKHTSSYPYRHNRHKNNNTGEY
ncbi:MAG TPA: hypothetical protein VLG50_01890 [Candidatus Saccharimonadales bacterium]|nr:hypothetical protein [Candidatus Saccharimonadales bacterium]